MSLWQDAGGSAAVVQAIQGAVDAGNNSRAVSLALTALDRGIQNPLILMLAAYNEERRGRFEEALKHLAVAERMAPADVLILCAIGRCLSKMGRPEQARTAFERAVSINANHAPAHHGLGLTMTALGDDEAAFATQKLAGELDANFPDPPGVLAELSLQRGDVAGARHYAERALRLNAFQPSANMVLATLASQDGDHRAAIERLQSLHDRGDLTALHQSVTQRMLARELDTVNDVEGAFAAYGAANAALMRIYGVDLERSGAETGRMLCRRLLAYFGKSDPDAWKSVAGPETTPAEGHVFLLGFVRSGTTLLEQVLASHPRIVALEEMPTLRALTPEFFTETSGLDRLSALSPDDAARLREDYWTRVRSFGVDFAGKVFVDKAPLSSIWQPLIAKLFPNARILLARRDPRDVVLSSFRHAFLINALTCAFVDLKETAGFYGEVMALCELYREKLRIPTHVHRHEAMIADFDKEIQDVCAFIGVDWDPAMREFAETAKRRDVRTPSAEQVRQGLNSSGVGQWRRYAGPMAPALPILAPWIERFGYPDA